MFSKQPRNISSRSSSSSTSLTRCLNITDGNKPPPGLNKPISHAASTPTVATSPVNAEGSLTTSKDDPTEKISKVEGKRRAWTSSQSNETDASPPVERLPVFVAPPPDSPQLHSRIDQLDPAIAADTAFEVDVSPSLRETESTPRPLPAMRRGMEKGYSLSPMYSLWLEYCNEGEASKSTQSRVVFYATKPSLARDEVVDRGANTSTDRYTVHRPLLEQISHTVNELQVFIQHMASLIEERHSYFQVDPDDTSLKVLGGAETTSQLHAAWIGLTSCLSAAQTFMLKYQQEYQDAPVPTSPVSTNPDIHRYITSLPDIDDRLRSIYLVMLISSRATRANG